MLQALHQLWKNAAVTHNVQEVPNDILQSVELVLDNKNKLCELNRLPGENEVSFITHKYR